MRGNGFFSFILVVLLALIAGGVGYAFGVNSAVSTAAVTAGTGTSTVVVANAGWLHGFWFFPFFGIFFVILFFGIIFSFIRHAAWGGRGQRGWGGGWHGYGPYGWTPRDPGTPGAPGTPGTAGSTGTSGSVPPGIDQMLQHWHRDAHGTPPTDASGQGQPPSAQG